MLITGTEREFIKKNLNCQSRSDISQVILEKGKPKFSLQENLIIAISILEKSLILLNKLLHCCFRSNKAHLSLATERPTTSVQVLTCNIHENRSKTSFIRSLSYATVISTSRSVLRLNYE